MKKYAMLLLAICFAACGEAPPNPDEPMTCQIEGTNLQLEEFLVNRPNHFWSCHAEADIGGISAAVPTEFEFYGNGLGLIKVKQVSTYVTDGLSWRKVSCRTVVYDTNTGQAEIQKVRYHETNGALFFDLFHKSNYPDLFPDSKVSVYCNESDRAALNINESLVEPSDEHR